MSRFIRLEGIAEFHEQLGGGDYHYYPAIRVTITPTVDGGEIIHRCEDLPGVHFDNKGAAEKYANEYLSSNTELVAEAVINCIKE